ncbi:diguanylate cyclase (GGDEF) domain-containing protein [Devosia crocina]|uniref:diguanylate cyclase n=1 Tax=Devosia crocina TaxID=429728 RepID=A0A1I7N5V3_9HYPH|nr:GGDEF domain-containing protein [Devosia crocina]SFV30038.1 diguanylate cyclase (GGDEF) domain-containing protein [Devosia crocina]
MVIDNATLLIGIAFSSASLLFALLIGWLNARSETYLVLGAMGMAFIVTAVMIMGLRAGHYGLAQHLVPYTLILIGFSFVFAGVRKFRSPLASVRPPIVLGTIMVIANAVPFLLGYTGIGLILLNTFSAILLTLCAVEHWRSKGHARVALNANAIIYCVTAFSFLACALVIIYEGELVVTAPPENWAEDFNSIMSLVGLTGIGALTLTLHHARAADRHRTEANTDSLTGTLNRRALFELFGNASPAPRTAVLMFDLDHFKQVNDRFGHAGGDRALQQFAQILRAELRRGDIAARLGGEEFCAVLPAIDQESAKLIAERIRAAYAALGMLLDDEGLSATVSIGLAITGPEEDFSALLSRADAALYLAKNGGRNQVRLAALRLVA